MGRSGQASAQAPAASFFLHCQLNEIKQEPHPRLRALLPVTALEPWNGILVITSHLPAPISPCFCTAVWAKQEAPPPSSLGCCKASSCSLRHKALPSLPGGTALGLTQIPDVGIKAHVPPAVLEFHAAVSHSHAPVAVGVPGEARGHPLGQVGVPLG